MRLVGAAYEQGFVFLRKIAREVGGVVRGAAQVEAVDDAKDARHAPKKGKKNQPPAFQGLINLTKLSLRIRYYGLLNSRVSKVSLHLSHRCRSLASTPVRID